MFAQSPSATVSKGAKQGQGAGADVMFNAFCILFGGVGVQPQPDQEAHDTLVIDGRSVPALSSSAAISTS